MPTFNYFMTKKYLYFTVVLSLCFATTLYARSVCAESGYYSQNAPYVMPAEYFSSDYAARNEYIPTDDIYQADNYQPETLSFSSSNGQTLTPPPEYYQFQAQNPQAWANTNSEPLQYETRYNSRRSGFSFSDCFHNFLPTYDARMNQNRENWSWQLMPDNIIYKAYMACKREPRLGIQFVDSCQPDNMSYWDCSIGARVSLLRYGSKNPLYPEGLELELDACAFPRLTLDSHRDLWSCDYRFGVPLAYRKGHWEYMFGYYHISSHLGDEYMVRHDSLYRLNYVRDCLMAGVGYRPNMDWRFYFHLEYGFWIDDGAKPWHLMFGFEYSPMDCNGFYGAPFLAMCARLRQDVDFSGSFSLEAGWQWRSKQSHVFRTGLFYFNGYSDHYQFYNVFEQQIGLGFWYDF